MSDARQPPEPDTAKADDMDETIQVMEQYAEKMLSQWTRMWSSQLLSHHIRMMVTMHEWAKHDHACCIALVHFGATR